MHAETCRDTHADTCACTNAFAQKHAHTHTCHVQADTETRLTQEQWLEANQWFFHPVWPINNWEIGRAHV